LAEAVGGKQTFEATDILSPLIYRPSRRELLRRPKAPGRVTWRENGAGETPSKSCPGAKCDSSWFSATITTVSLVGRVNGESFEISLDGTNSFREGKARITCAPPNRGAVA